MSVEVTHTRTARILNEIRYTSPFGAEIIIEAGSPARAEQLTLMMSSNYAPTPRYANGANDPIEWCTIPTDGQPVCIFWEGEEKARYISTYASAALHVVTPSGASGMVGPMPQIEEQDVDFGVTLTRDLIVEKWNRRGVDLLIRVLEDGVVGQARRRRVGWNQALLSVEFGASFRLTPIGPAERPTGVNVEIIPLR